MENLIHAVKSLGEKWWGKKTHSIHAWAYCADTHDRIMTFFSLNKNWPQKNSKELVAHFPVFEFRHLEG